MDYRYLKAFTFTAQFLSFSRAAEKLNIAQSAVSRQIKLLEESIGEELIIRSSKKVLLTDKGKDLYLATIQYEKTLETVLTKDSIKVIRIGVLHGLLETWLCNLLGEYKSKYPHNLQIRIGEPESLKQGITEGKYDIIFTTENIQNELVSSLKLFNEKLVVISKKEIDTAKLQSYPWVVYGENDFFFKNYKKHSKTITIVNSVTAIIQLVKSNVGIALVPDHILRSGDRLNTYEVKSSNSSSIHMATLNFKSLPEHLKELLELVKRNK